MRNKLGMSDERDPAPFDRKHTLLRQRECEFRAAFGATSRTIKQFQPEERMIDTLATSIARRRESGKYLGLFATHGPV